MPSDEQVKHVWTIGSYPDVGQNFLSMAAHLVDAVDVGPGDRVLDVACGTGNVAITAARRGADVTGLDITPAMLDDARKNAEVAGVDVDWREGDATDLPFPDDAFDVALSCVGHMFAAPADAAAEELLRVTRSGGRVAFTSWTPGSVVPAMAMVLNEYIPPDSDGPDPPFLWGDPAVVSERLGDSVDDLEFDTAAIQQLDISPAHYWEGAVENSGMFIVALDNVDEDDRPALRADMIETIERYFDDGLNAVAMEYRLTKAQVL